MVAIPFSGFSVGVRGRLAQGVSTPDGTAAEFQAARRSRRSDRRRARELSGRRVSTSRRRDRHRGRHMGCPSRIRQQCPAVAPCVARVFRPPPRRQGPGRTACAKNSAVARNPPGPTETFRLDRPFSPPTSHRRPPRHPTSKGPPTPGDLDRARTLMQRLPPRDLPGPTMARRRGGPQNVSANNLRRHGPAPAAAEVDGMRCSRPVHREPGSLSDSQRRPSMQHQQRRGTSWLAKFDP
jgi:hypothetical protein